MDTFEHLGPLRATKEPPAQPVEAAVAYRKRRLPRLCAPISMALLSVTVIIGGFVAYQRAGTDANASVIETTQNLGGGFLAVGFSEDQPGFLVASALDQEQVRLDADQMSYFLAGTHTRVEVETPAQVWRKRLRNPVVITIDSQGNIASTPVDWSLHTLTVLADTADCKHESHLIKKHCGAPFLDVSARIAKWPLNTVPPNLREFLTAAP